jgi:hypothetical protein
VAWRRAQGGNGASVGFNDSLTTDSLANAKKMCRSRSNYGALANKDATYFR